MVSLVFVFFLLISLFGVIGAMRGWAKEMLVIFSVVLALFLINLLERYAPFFPPLPIKPPDNIAAISPDELKNLQYAFWFRTLIVALLSYFGFQTPFVQRFIKGERLVRERLQDTLLGLLFGLVNGFLIVGTILYYLNQTAYPFPNMISPPVGKAAEAMTRLLPILPPRWLGVPGIYFAVGVAFIFILIVFI